MTATAQAGRKSGPGYAKHPSHLVETEPCPKRVRVMFNGETIADSTAVLLMRESRHTPVYYFPADDVRMDLFTATDHHTYCPFKGEASYWSVTAGDRTAENAVWGYLDPYVEVDQLQGYVAFYWDRMDAWFEDDQEVFVHATDPKVRIDIRDSHRPVKVILGGTVVAETTNARLLYETGLPTRYYIPRADVRMDLLAETDTVTACPYKGTARYSTARTDAGEWPDVVWSYPDPLPESTPIKDMLCFFNEHVDAIEVDGVAVPKVKTKWSKD